MKTLRLALAGTLAGVTALLAVILGAAPASATESQCVYAKNGQGQVIYTVCVPLP